MKTKNRILLAAAMAAGLALASPAMAQNNTVGDGIAASPKARKMLNERAQVNVASTATSTASAKACCERTDLAASPKTSQMLAEQKKCCVAPTTGTVASATDGITASPKLREQLNERQLKFQIAPLK
jgi:hypothetical protein